MAIGTICTERLELIPFDPRAIRFLLDGDREAAERVLQLPLPREFPSQDELAGFLAIQLRRMEDAPERREWMARIMKSRDADVIGHCGFHGPPDIIGRAEIGYTVFASHRGQGYAKEAAAALVHWAFEQGETKVYASVSPSNAPSLAVVLSLGFRQVGTQVDDVDGLELVFVIESNRP